MVQETRRGLRSLAQAAKGAGAVKRLESEGQPLDARRAEPGERAAVQRRGLNGKVVVVYYWASWSQSLAEDVRKLNGVVKEYGSKGLEIVTCASITTPGRGRGRRGPQDPRHAPLRPGGIDGSPLAASYGILVVPHMFVAGKDGKVMNRSAQAATVEDDVKKLLP